MRNEVLLRTPYRKGARLNLVPRLRPDESLSSWLERLAGRYAMNPLGLLQWMGYPCTRSPSHPVGSRGVGRLDLDIEPPLDLPRTLAHHCGTSAKEIEALRLPAYGTLREPYRRTFCASCWAEDGPYRRREWASGWSMICVRHRQLLCERAHIEDDLRDVSSWIAFYDSPMAWKTTRPPWEGEMWQEICVTFAVNPRTEFFRMWRWLADLQSLASLARDFPHIHHANAVDPCQGDVRVKRDLTMYALFKFWNRALLKYLVPAIDEIHLTRGWDEDLCMHSAPNTNLRMRLLACLAGRHLWECLEQRARGRTGQVSLKRYLGDSQRSTAEEWWLEARIRSWPARWQVAGREIFGLTFASFVGPRQWSCYESCISGESRVVRPGTEFRLPPNWQCRRDCPREVMLQEQARLERARLKAPAACSTVSGRAFG